MTQTTILSVYPLSAEYAEALQHRFNGARFLTLRELRGQRGFGLLRKLRDIRSELLVLPLEDESSRALLPIVKIVGMLTAARKVVLADPELSTAPVSRLELFFEVARLGMATIACLSTAVAAAVDVSRLARAPRAEVRPPDKGPVVYLKTNLWFGVKAGGSVGHVAGVANALTRSGYPVAFVAAEPPMMVDANIATEPVSPPRTYGLPYELNNYRFQRAYERVATNVLGSTRHAFIYQRLSPGNYLGARLSRRFQLPLVVEYNGSEAWIAKNWGRPLLFHGLAVRTEQVLLTQAHLVVTVSDVLRDELIARGIEPDRIVVYPNCIDPDTFDPRRFTVNDRNALRATYRIPSDAVLCSFVGTFGQWHGVHVLAKAIARLWTDQRDWLVKNNVRFMLIGDGLRMGEVRAILDDSGATAICTLAGLIPQPETPRYLAASDILLSPHVSNTDGTRFFGSPTKLFEYMAMGKSIYASRLDQIADVLAPSLNVASLPGSPPDDKTQALAVLGQPGDENDIIAGVKFLVEHSDWSATLGANARSKALEKYTWDHHTGAILRGLAQLTGAK